MSMFISGSGPESESFVILGSSPPLSELSHHPTSITELNDDRECSMEAKTRSIVENPISNIVAPPFLEASMSNSRSGPNSHDYAQDFLMGKLSAQQLESFTNVEDLEKADEVKRIQDTMAGLINTIKTNNIFMRQHYSKIQKYQNDVATLHKEHEEQLKKRDIAFNLITKENQAHKNEIDKLVLELSTKKDLQMVVTNLTKTLDDHKTQILLITAENEQLKRDSEDIKTNFKVNFNFLENEKYELQQNISEKLSVIQNMSAEIERLKIGPKASLSDYVSLSDHRNAISQLENRLSTLVSQNMELLSMKSKFEDEINCREVYLTKLKEDINAMNIAQERKNNMELASQTTLQSSIEVLNIQMETFRSDFEIERQARQTLAGEKEQLITELKLLQRRNQQLTEELSTIERGATSTSSAPMTQRNQTRSNCSSSPNSSSVNIFKRNSSSTEREYQRLPHICPLCAQAFSTIKHLEYHVDSCLEN